MASQVQTVNFQVVSNEVVDSRVMLQVTFGYVETPEVPGVMVEFTDGSQYIYYGDVETIDEFDARVAMHVQDPTVNRLGAYFNRSVRPLNTIRVA